MLEGKGALKMECFPSFLFGNEGLINYRHGDSGLTVVLWIKCDIFFLHEYACYL